VDPLRVIATWLAVDIASRPILRRVGGPEREHDCLGVVGDVHLGGLIAHRDRQDAPADLVENVRRNAPAKVWEAGVFPCLRHHELEGHMPHLCVPHG